MLEHSESKETDVTMRISAKKSMDIVVRFERRYIGWLLRGHNSLSLAISLGR
jgi:hypothetical protein